MTGREPIPMTPTDSERNYRVGDRVRFRAFGFGQVADGVIVKRGWFRYLIEHGETWDGTGPRWLASKWVWPRNIWRRVPHD